ncbi:amidohydrolase [Agromyces endophyticus]|uniref:amidohydrolase n=1 Tax=Agromyces sp. H17E-10 TaxID=2932244 RepID=UPI001FCFF94B|nr:amidohydrolase [Agromyces sp. H17E-10]UOQ90452.1 amidohydrolase [Agromyces sp. H17E-10]
MSRTLVTNARIFTANRPGDGAEWAEALVVDGETLAYVGDAASAAEAAGPDAEKLDLGGRLVVPGFLDVHTHLHMLGDALGRVQLRDARDLGEIQARLRAARDAAPDAPHLLGVSWLFDSVPGGSPTRQMIDEVVADVPVFLDANDLHSTWVNSAALAELGITRDTPDPLGGRIGRDAEGEPDGMLYETAAQYHVWTHLAEVATDADRDAAVERALDAYLAAGVTGAADMSFGELELASIERVAARRGGLPFHLVGYWLIDNTGDDAENLAQVARAVELAQRPATPWLRIAGIKLITDGVIDACTAAMRAPYADGSNADPIWPYAQMAPVVAAADAAGLQVALHAIGDAASSSALDAIEHAIEVNGDRPAGRPRRHRVEHLEYAAPGTAERMARLGVTASMQPVHCDPSIMDNWKAQLGDHRVDRGFAWPEYRDAGALLAFSTDAPTAPHPALPNLYIATTRKSALDPSLPAYAPEFALPLAEALGHATRDAAASIREEDERGRLAAGLAADFAVLDADPFEAGESALLDARVIRTVVGGSTVYEA